MLQNVATAETVTLYWDLPELYQKGDMFVIEGAGRAAVTTEQCHYTVEGLKAETEYNFTVSMNGETIGCAAVCTEKIKRKINITEAPYCAVGDGKTLNTKAIQRAFDDCTSDACVYIPSGDFMTGALFMHSDMELYLEKGAVLHGTVAYEDYEPKIRSRFEGTEMMCYASLLNVGELDREKGITCRNVRICGEGTVCGGGAPLRQNIIDRERILMKEYMESLGDKILECENADTIPGRARGRLINISCAQHIVISGITVKEGPCWNVHMIYSDDVVTHGVTFVSKGISNGDGWDPDSSTNCTLFGSVFMTGDDAVAIKSGKNPEGNIVNIPCEHIRVFDCISHFGHGITIGSEMSGGVNDVRVWNCDMGVSMYGLEIKGTKKRGGYVRNVYVSHCKVCRILLHSVGYNDDGEGAPEAPIFENCLFEDMEVTAVMHSRDDEDVLCEAIEVAGFDTPGHEAKNIRFKNIVIGEEGGNRSQNIRLQSCAGITLENIRCR